MYPIKLESNQIQQNGNRKAIFYSIIILILGVIGFCVLLNAYPDPPQMQIIETHSAIEPSISTVQEEQEDTLPIVENPVFSAQIIEGDLPAYATLIPIYNASADSVLVTSSGVKFSAENLIDSDLTTSWQEGEADFGYETTIDIELGEYIAVNYLVIYNGNQLSEKKYNQNNRPKDILIAQGEQCVSVTLPDTMSPIVIELTGTEPVDHISIEIMSVYSGSKYNDTCLSEIQCYYQ